MRIALLHTGAVHQESFEALFRALEPDLELHHVVNEELLNRARVEGLGAIRSETHDILLALSDSDAVLCTCSTLGPLVDEMADVHKNILRIDRPLMEAACSDGAQILVAVCLESTRDATLELLEASAADLGVEIAPEILLCDGAWPHFEAGDMAAYAREIAIAIRQAVRKRGKTDCIVLAQASMRVAEIELTDLDIPVRSSPELAVARSVELARSNR